MTENVKTFELKIGGINSVKELKQYIDELRDSLVRLDETSEEYTSTVDELIAAETKLKTVMSDSKELLNEAKGSYNALVNEMEALKNVWKEVTDETERSRIGEKIAEINTELKSMESSISNFQKNIGNYEEGSYNALINEMKTLKTVLGELPDEGKDFNLNINGIDSVKSLKQYISDLRDALVVLDSESEEYTSTVDKLIAAETKLKTVMSASKETLNVTKGSYNSLVAEMGSLKNVLGELPDEDKVFNLNINGIDSVKSLKQYISDLRDALVNLDDKSEEYSQVVDELVASQKKLNTVMGASKESLKGSEGSYNALVNEMKALKTVWREVTDEGKRNEIGARIAEINSELKTMDSSIGNFQRNVGNYEEAITKAFMTPQQELKKLKTELASMEQGTDEYNQTFNRMAQLTHDVTEQQEMLRWSSADLGDILGNLAGVAAGLAGGFSAINAVQGLIGSGNEDVERAMQTTQNWIQLIQGLEAVESLGDKITGLWEGLKNYAEAQKQASIETEKTNMSLASNVVQTNRAATATVGFTGGLKKAIVSVKTLALSIKTALISSGIGLLIVALGTAVSYLWKFVDGTDKAEKASKKMEDANDKLNKSLEKSKDEWEYQEKLMKAQGKSYDEIYEAKKKALQQDLNLAKQTFKTNEATAKTIGLKNLEKEKYADVNAAYKESKEKVEELTKALSDLDKERNIEKIKEETEAREKATEAYKKQLDEAKKLYEDLKDYYKKDTDRIKDKYDKDFAIINKSGLSKVEKEEAINLLLKKREEEITKAVYNSKKEYITRFREDRKKQLELEEGDLEKHYENEKSELEVYKLAVETALSEIGKDSSKEKFEIDYLNMQEGTDFKYVFELETALKGVNKQLSELKSQNAFEELGKQANQLQNDFREHLQLDDLLGEVINQEDKKSIFGIEWGEPKDLSYDILKQQMEQRYQVQEEYINSELELWQNALDSEVLIGEQKAEAMNRIYDLINQKEMLSIQKSIEANDLRVENFKMAVDSMKGIADSLGSIFGSVSDIIMSNAQAQLDAGDISEEEYKKEFERAKKFQIAEAVINTISGAVGAFTGIMKSTGGWGIALAVAQMAAVLATGYAQIEQIKNTTVGSSSSNSSSSSKYAMATPSATSDFNPQLTQNATGSREQEDLMNAISSKPLRAFVVESDISSAQARTQQRTKESTF